MKKTLLCFVAIISMLVFNSCSRKNSQSEMTNAKEEILSAEKQFGELCKKEGIEKAFTTYADNDAKILLGDKVLNGKAEIQAHYSKPLYKTATLIWSPDFVDVSTSCDLGYTYGKFTFTNIDSSGNQKVSYGIFHTVWKKQSDGVWKFVWDN
jgi:ketosteroid isomerase-like protein